MFIDVELKAVLKKNANTQNSINILIECCILPFSKIGDLRLQTSHRGITLTAIAEKVRVEFAHQFIATIEAAADKGLYKHERQKHIF